MINIEEIERKKQKKLSKDHWMCKIQKFSLGIDARSYYKGYCPLFWMSWLCLLLFPFVCVFKLIRIICRPFTNFLQNSAYNRQERQSDLMKSPLVPTYAQLITLDKELSLYCCSQLISNLHESYYLLCYCSSLVLYRDDAHRMALWFIENPDWKKEHLPAAKKYMQDMELFKLREETPWYTVRDFINIVSVIGKLVFKILIPCAILAGVFLLYMTVISIPIMSWLAILIVVCAVCSVILIFSITYDFFENLTKVNITEKKPSVVSNIITFFVDAVKITYKQECPLIIWGDETGSIEKRNSNE